MAHPALQLSHLTLSPPPLARHASSASHFRRARPGLPASHTSLPFPPVKKQPILCKPSLVFLSGLSLRLQVTFYWHVLTVSVLPSDHALPTGPTMKAVSSLLWSLSIQSLATSQLCSVCWRTNAQFNSHSSLEWSYVPPAEGKTEQINPRGVRGVEALGSSPHFITREE